MTIVSTADRARTRALLEHALGMSGMNPQSVVAMTEAALAVGALDSGSPLASASPLASGSAPDAGSPLDPGSPLDTDASADAHSAAQTLPASQTPRASTGSGSIVPRLAVVQPPSAGGPTPPEHSVDSHLRSAGGLLSVIESLTQVATRLDAALVLAARQQTAAIGRSLLAERGVDSPEDLSTSQRARWRARAKSLSRHEIEAVTGWGAGEVVDLVGLATAPAEATQPAIDAMANGLAPWRLTRAFWRDCGHLGTDEAVHVAEVLFGTDPSSCAPERLDPEGEVSEAPWFHREFRAALRREIVRLRSTDLAVARAAREAALASRTMGVTIDENGTGAITLVGSALQATAIADRIDNAARRARAAGDARTLAQLRNDVGLSLMLHGTVTQGASHPSGSSGGEDSAAEDAVRTAPEGDIEWTAELAQILTGMPSATLQVIVPFAAVHAGAAPPPGRTGSARRGGPSPTAHNDETPPGAPTPSDGEPPDSPTPSDDHPPGAPTPSDDSSPGAPLPVGQVLGAHSTYVSLDEIHDLALLPGTVLERLLVDPADGRCVERSLESYRPDAAMRAQILAADVTCRAPGCLVHGAACQLDHVIEYASPGGATAETNLAPLHVGHHHPKTLKAWDSSLARNRDMTWTSLLGRLYRTRSHDYRQYVHLVTDALGRVHETAGQDRAHQVDREILLALAHRAGDEMFQAGDDTVEPDESRFGGWGFVTLSHTDDRGIRRSGPSGALLAERAAAQADSARDSARPALPHRGLSTDHQRTGTDSVTGSKGPTESEPGRTTGRSDDPADSARRSAERLRRDEGPPPF